APGDQRRWGGTAVADFDHQVVETGQRLLHPDELRPKDIGRVERVERAPLALGMPFRRERAHPGVDDMPCDRVNVPPAEVLARDLACLVEQLVHAVERRDLVAFAVAEALRRNARYQLDMQLGGGLAIGVVRLPRLVAPGGEKCWVEQRLIESAN